MLGMALGYVVAPWDLVPDDAPIVGALDDLVVLCLALALFAEDLPEGLLEEKLLGLGISRSDYERDLSQVRWIVPWPIRRLFFSLPGMIRAGGSFVRQTGLDRRLRARIITEESTA